MKWKKLGLIYCASGENEKMVAGGRTPVALHIKDDQYRIYFGCYDKFGRGRIFSLDIDIKVPNQIFNLNTKPIIDFGSRGFFDDNGIIPSDIMRINNKIYLYTIGFSLKNKLLFDAASGLAISEDNGVSFNKFKGPVLDKGVDDPCFAASPCVIKEKKEWRMWYVSCDHWEKINQEYRHFYNIKYRKSKDGIYWDNQAKICIDYKNEYEYAISRPYVKYLKNKYLMWYSFRAQKKVFTYRIGYAESVNGIDWVRKDNHSGIDVSQSGWDSEMICYPFVFLHKDNLYMLYNGNGYGKTGFGIAIAEENI